MSHNESMRERRGGEREGGDILIVIDKSCQLILAYPIVRMSNGTTSLVS